MVEPRNSSPQKGYPDHTSPHQSSDPKTALIEEMLLFRNAVCHEHALTINHNHCIGCALVMEYMEKNHANIEYGSQHQWEIESAFCLMHERDIIKDFLERKSGAQ